MPDPTPDDHAAHAPLPRETLEMIARVVAEVLAALPARPADRPEPPALLTREQSAHLCGVSLSAWGDLESRGFVGPVAVRLGDGRIVRYSRAQLLDWIASGCPPRQRWTTWHRKCA